ncbi:MAG: hypothetical protein JW934_22920 [Anaerolineae bacterium]|nr:hypothetical protein [Anaerolineae bacterium]
MARLSLSLLGPPLIALDGQPVQVGRHKAIALLAYLALDQRPHSRDALATMFWPDLDQSAARAELRRTLSLLNRTLGSQWLAVDRETAAWASETDVWLDVEALRGQVAACAAHGHPPDDLCPACIPLLAQAVELYRDGFLAGFTLPDAPAFDEWQFFEGEGLRDQAASALQRLARWHEGQQAYDVAIPYARRWLALDPTHEPAQRTLMTLYARAGQRAAALRQYAECERLLAQELGITPDGETAQLYQAIRERREDLSGFGKPDRSVRQHNLPVQITSFVGRGRELAALGRLLANPEVRLLTVVGAGGMGKTRLALEAAQTALSGYPAGAWLVELAPLPAATGDDDPTIPRAVAAALGVQEQPGRCLLLVLDNCEHVLAGAAHLVALLLARCPELAVLATSREPLCIAGEHLVDLSGMDLPAAQDLSGFPKPDRSVVEYDAVRLFAQRAAAVRPGFALDEANTPLAVEVCRRLDGMPLAIELAAARLHTLSLPDLARHLDHRFRLLTGGSRAALPRQQTLRNTIEWSYDLLTPAEQTLFDRLSVFAGSFSLQGAEAVCSGQGIAREEVLALLIGLVDRSLAGQVEGPDGTTLYRLLETLRIYGEERLAERGEGEAFAARHAWYTVSLAEELEPVLWAHERETIAARRRLDAEAENLAAAMRWALARGQAEVALRLGGALYWWTFMRANNEQYAAWLDTALAQGPDVAPLFRAKALWVVSVYHLNWGHQAEALASAQAMLEAARASGDLRWTGRALAELASTAANTGDRARARACHHESLQIARQCDDRLMIATEMIFLAGYEPPARRRAILEELLPQAPHCVKPFVHRSLATMLLFLGDLDGAQAHYEAAAAGCAEQGDQAHQGIILAFMGHVAYGRAEYPSARQYYEQSHALFVASGLAWAAGRTQQHLGDVALALGEQAQAERHHRQALARYEEAQAYWMVERAEIGGCWGIPVSLQILGDMALARGSTGEARDRYRQAVRRGIDQPYPDLHLHLLLGPARLLAREGQREQAVALAALAQHHPESIQETRDKAGLLLDALRAEMDANVFDAAQERGRARDLDQTVRELLEELEQDTDGAEKVKRNAAARAGRSAC